MLRKICELLASTDSPSALVLQGPRKTRHLDALPMEAEVGPRRWWSRSTHLGVAWLVTEQFVVGLDARYKQEGPVEASLLAGGYLPRTTMSTGPIAMLRVGLNS